MRSKHDLSLAFAFAAAAQPARERAPDPCGTVAGDVQRRVAFRRRRVAEPASTVHRHATAAPGGDRAAVFAVIDSERQVKWMQTRLERLRADDLQIRRQCGKRIPPP